MAILEMTRHFNWNENEKQDILGVFFWGFALTKFSSGRLAEVIGPRKVIGFSMLLASILTILTPFILNFYILLTSRIILGILLGAFWPSVLPLTFNWIPPSQQSSFLACLNSSGFGITIGYFVCGFLISAFGWQSVFYVSGAISLIWTLFWFYFFYDSPKDHPRLSSKEKEILCRNIDCVVKSNFFDIPWKEIVTSKPVWAIVLGQTSLFFGYATLINVMPSFIQDVFKFDIKNIGIVAGLPFCSGYIGALSSGYLADHLHKTKRFSTLTIRKIFETIAFATSAFMLVVFCFWGDVAAIAIISFTVVIASGGSASAGHIANVLDISPNYGGSISGFANTVASLPLYFSTKIVALLIGQDHSFENWRYLFWLLVGVYGFGNVAFLVLSSAKRQRWDTFKDDKTLEEQGEALTSSNY